jgi:hypothetical protein
MDLASAHTAITVSRVTATAAKRASSQLLKKELNAGRSRAFSASPAFPPLTFGPGSSKYRNSSAETA